MNQYRYRKYVPGDEHAINELYYAVTGRKRSIKEFLWQWQEAPSGRGEIWLIESVESNGSVKLIGHHGIMPIVFSNGKIDIIAGKTENTMVLKEYRRKILYPKYERIFFSDYEKRFDVLFSTMGPPDALRQRLPLGYKAQSIWENYIWFLGVGAIFSYIALSFFARHKKKSLRIIGKTCSYIGQYFNKLFQFKNKKKSKVSLTVLKSDEAKDHPFFNLFWKNARCFYEITPRRNREDLQWRFWDNPYGDHTTFIYEGSDGDSAYAIIRNLGTQTYRLEDIVISPLNEKFLIRVLNSICEWVYNHGGNILRFDTTNDQNKIVEMFRTFNLQNSYISQRKRQVKKFMPIKLNCKKCENKKWYITPFVFEGRL
jgi:hypothetical protein